MCVHATHNAKIQVIMQSHLPPPSLKTIWNQLSSSLYLPGVAWVDSLTVMFIQRIDRCNAPEKSGQKKTKKSLFIHIPFPLGEYQPQRKPLPVYISWLQILPEFLFGMQPLEQTGSPQRMWSLSPPKLEVWWDAGHQDTLLGPSTWLLHLSFPFQNFKRISRHWSLHRRWFISWSYGFMAMILKLSIRSPGKPKKDTSSFSPTSTSLVPALFLSSQGDFDTHQSLRTTTVSH